MWISRFDPKRRHCSHFWVTKDHLNFGVKNLAFENVLLPCKTVIFPFFDEFIYGHRTRSKLSYANDPLRQKMPFYHCHSNDPLRQKKSFFQCHANDQYENKLSTFRCYAIILLIQVCVHRQHAEKQKETMAKDHAQARDASQRLLLEVTNSSHRSSFAESHFTDGKHIPLS